MAGVSDVIYRGYGAWSSMSKIPTHGYGIGDATVYQVRTSQESRHVQSTRQESRYTSKTQSDTRFTQE